MGLEHSSKPDDAPPEITIPPVNTCLMVLALFIGSLIAMLIALVSLEAASRGRFSQAAGGLLTSGLVMGGLGVLAAELGATTRVGPEGFSRHFLGVTFGRIPWSRIASVRVSQLRHRGVPCTALVVSGDFGHFGFRRNMTIQEHGRALHLQEAEHVARHYLRAQSSGDDDPFAVRRA